MIGAGSGGLTVAAAAAQFGVEVVLVERGAMGGDCLNTGCVPSKALIAAARHVAAVREASEFGISAGEPTIDFARVMAHVHETIGAIAPHDSEERFTGLGVRVIRAAGRFVGPETVEAGGHRIRARRFVVATGSRAAVPPIPGLADCDPLTNESVFDLAALPRRLIVLGGGPIGLELGQAFRRLGAEVMVLEAQRAFGRDDPELAGVALARIRAEGVEIREGVKILRFERGADGGVAAVVAGAGGAGEDRVEGDRVLVAAGRRANTEGLGLEAAGIRFDQTGILVDQGLRTTNRRVLAIGDVAAVAGEPPLRFTHVAGHHGGLAVRSILFRLPVRVRREIVPWITYTDPEVGWVGLDEAAARARFGDKVRVLRRALADNDRARTERATDGLVKLVVGPGGRILGAGAVGRHAGDMIDLWSLAVANGLKVRHMAGYISPYPTVAEAGRRAALSWYEPGLTSPWVRRIIRFLRLFG